MLIHKTQILETHTYIYTYYVLYKYGMYTCYNGSGSSDSWNLQDGDGIAYCMDVRHRVKHLKSWLDSFL